MSGVTLHKNLI